MTRPPLQVLIEPYLRLIEARFWIEGALALIAALFAIALRRQRRLFKAPGFIMLALGLIIDMMIPRAPALQSWTNLGRAIALLLVAFGLTCLAVETFLILRFRRRADLLQYHRPFVSGDWVRLGDHLGRIVGTGWRATWMVTRNDDTFRFRTLSSRRSPSSTIPRAARRWRTRSRPRVLILLGAGDDWAGPARARLKSLIRPIL